MDEIRVGYRLLLLVSILLVNGFFAASEVALVSVRRSRLKQMAAEGHAGARAALQLLAKPERLLSVVQVGVTLASIGLGWTGEGTLFAIFDRLFGPLVSQAHEPILRGVTFAVSFLLISYAHTVVGEVVPKNIAIENADRLAVMVAPLLLTFHRIVSPFVFVIERSAAALSRLVGVREPLGGGHSAEELKFVIEASRRHGQLDTFEEAAIQRILDLQQYLVREIMVPRSEMVSVLVEADLEEVLSLMETHHFSRIPVYEDEPEHIIGVLHFKDVLSAWHQRAMGRTERRESLRKVRIRRFMRKPFVVPETKPVNQLIDEFRREHLQMAIVVDEFGTVVGLVTMEDVLEQIFGEIEDEHDVHLPPVLFESPLVELEGTISIRDLETQYGIDLPVDAGFETLAGFMLYRFGNIPETGQTVEEEGYRFTVLEVEHHRIVRVRVERIEGAAPAEDAPS